MFPGSQEEQVQASVEEAVEAMKRLVAAIVDEPADFPVTALQEGDRVFIEIRHEGDRAGQIIGKHGRNIDALRTVAQALFGKLHLHVQLELITADSEQ